MKRKRIVLGVVAAEIQAENIVQRLAHVGIASRDISVVFPHRHGTRDFAHEHHTKAPESADSIAGALIGMGIPELEAKQYEGKLRNGNILLAAHVESPEEEARVKEVLRREAAHDIRSTSESVAPAAE